MNTTPEIDAILSRLTELCCSAMDAEGGLDRSRVDQLTKSLSANGWKRHSEDAPPLSTILKNRIKESCREPAMHRGAAIDGIVESVQDAYDNQSRMSASSPGGK